MHELAIAESVVSKVLERAGGRVTVVRLRVGCLSGVVPDALMFCFELAAAGTTLEGAALEIEEQAGRRTVETATTTSRCEMRSSCATVGVPMWSCCPVASSR